MIPERNIFSNVNTTSQKNGDAPFISLAEKQFIEAFEADDEVAVTNLIKIYAKAACKCLQAGQNRKCQLHHTINWAVVHIAAARKQWFGCVTETRDLSYNQHDYGFVSGKALLPDVPVLSRNVLVPMLFKLYLKGQRYSYVECVLRREMNALLQELWDIFFKEASTAVPWMIAGKPECDNNFYRCMFRQFLSRGLLDLAGLMIFCRKRVVKNLDCYYDALQARSLLPINWVLCHKRLCSDPLYNYQLELLGKEKAAIVKYFGIAAENAETASKDPTTLASWLQGNPASVEHSLYMSLMHNRTCSAKIILKHLKRYPQSCPDALHFAIRSRKLSMVRLFSKVDFALPDSYGITPLILSVLTGKLKLVAYVLKRVPAEACSDGIDKNIDQSPLALSRYLCHDEIEKLFLRKLARSQQ